MLKSSLPARLSLAISCFTALRLLKFLKLFVSIHQMDLLNFFSLESFKVVSLFSYQGPLLSQQQLV